MHHAPVGIRCPEHANIGAAKPSATRTVRQARGVFTRSYAPVTTGLIAANIVVFLAMLATGGTLTDTSGSTVFARGALIGTKVAEGEWWRLGTAMFLHASLIHIGLNMFVLWVVGSAVEQLIGAHRYLLVYLAAGLAGSAGALLLPITRVGGQIVTTYYANLPTVGASGAIYGIFGALLVLEYIATGSFTGQAMTLILINLGLSFAISNVSIGGHIGGLIGGVLATAALAATRYKRQRWLGPALVVCIGLVSIALAVARARGTI
jgi:membrane associated rhomboid family serine protease